MFLRILSVLLLSTTCTWSIPLSGKVSNEGGIANFLIPSTTNRPSTAAPPNEPSPASINITGHSFRAHLEQDMIMNNMQNVRFAELVTNSHGSYVIGSLVNLRNGTIIAPVDGLYHLQVSLQLNVLSKNFNKLGTLDLALCNNYCDSIPSDNALLHYTSRIHRGKMTLDTSGILLLMANQTITIHLMLPKYLNVEIKSTTTVSATLLVV